MEEGTPDALRQAARERRGAPPGRARQGDHGPARLRRPPRPDRLAGPL